MKILAIETSCDETALAIVEGADEGPVRHLGSVLRSQAKIHEQYGGVFPALAKREHAKNLIPLFDTLIRNTRLHKEKKSELPTSTKQMLEKILEREPELLNALLSYFTTIEKPDIDYVAVTEGPGLEPALWVGINFAKALHTIWNIPIIGINHMEGHIFSVLFDEKNMALKNVEYPVLALLISGGHTELVLAENQFAYNIIGKTKDDAVGEAFDKVARMMNLPYPGGPHISELAEANRRSSNRIRHYTLPRPMIHSKDFDFSFSGLKTAVLYTIRTIKMLSIEDKQALAEEFENAVTEVLLEKTRRAIAAHVVRTLIVAGGVIGNIHLRKSFEALVKEFNDLTLRIPPPHLTGDNAVMIALAGFFRIREGKTTTPNQARGNLRLQ